VSLLVCQDLQTYRACHVWRAQTSRSHAPVDIEAQVQAQVAAQLQQVQAQQAQIQAQM
jgi:hypothetical protein